MRSSGRDGDTDSEGLAMNLRRGRLAPFVIMAATDPLWIQWAFISDPVFASQKGIWHHAKDVGR
jgi:hypothetical protein